MMTFPCCLFTGCLLISLLISQLLVNVVDSHHTLYTVVLIGVNVIKMLTMSQVVLLDISFHLRFKCASYSDNNGKH